jgi:hypothetical protein
MLRGAEKNADCVYSDGLDAQEPPWFVRNDTAINGIIRLAGWQLVPRTDGGDRGNARLTEGYGSPLAAVKAESRNVTFSQM